MTASRQVVLALAFVCALGLAFNIWMAVNNTDAGVDFNQFYSASRLAGTGQLYNWEALRLLEAEHGRETPTGRLPVEAFAIKLFVGWMPFSVARIVWLLASFAALLVCVFAWPGAAREWMIAALAWSMPAGLLLLLGQDTPFWMMFMALGLLLLARGHSRWGGLVFALCICKFHLAVGIPILLLAHKRWNTIAAGAIIGTILAIACFAIEGLSWPARYLANFPMFSPAPFRMPNLHGIAFWFPWSGPVEIVLCLALAVLLFYVCRSTRDLGLCGAAAAAAGLLLGGHAYANDCFLVLPLLVFTMQRPHIPAWLKIWAILLLTPGPTILLTTQKPFAGQFLYVGFVIVALTYEALRTAPQAPQKVEVG